jgi:segregation and condensation protein A
LEYAGDFLVTAASLMQIKSRMLLPKHQSENEDALEDETENDPRRALVERLLEYQRFQGAAETLRFMRDERAQLFSRPSLAPDLAAALAEANGASPRAEDDGAVLLRDVSTFDLLRALQKVLDRVAEAPVAVIRREPFTLPERVRALTKRLASTREGLTFGALCDDCGTRLEIVITFLAVLEMIARKKAIAVQRALFDEIWIEPAESF